MYAAAGVSAVCLVAGGCESVQTSGLPPARETGAVLILDGTAYGPDAIEDGLSEIAGALAIEEFALERRLTDLCELEGIEITGADLAREREDLVRTFTDLRPDRERAGVDALEAVRVERGLGPTRFAGLIRRNAMLRALVRGTVVVEDDEIADARAEPDAGDRTEDEIRRELRRRKELDAMERLAQDLIAGADVRVLDRSLGWSWRNRAGPAR